jgi:hypothetical protein
LFDEKTKGRISRYTAPLSRKSSQHRSTGFSWWKMLGHASIHDKKITILFSTIWKQTKFTIIHVDQESVSIYKVRMNFPKKFNLFKGTTSKIFHRLAIHIWGQRCPRNAYMTHFFRASVPLIFLLREK